MVTQTERGLRAASDDATYDRYARMVQRLLGTPTALVTIVEPDRQRFPGAVGLAEPWASLRETPLSHSFCQYVVADTGPLIVSDAREDDRLKTNLAIDELGVIAYAGWPLTDEDGNVVGSLCAIDSVPRVWDNDSLEMLSDLAAACSSELRERRLRQQAADNARAAADLSRRSQVLLSLSEGLSSTQTIADVAHAVDLVSLIQLGCSSNALWLRDGGLLTTVPPRGSSAEPVSVPIAGKHPLGHVIRTGAAAFLTRPELIRAYPDLPADEIDPDAYKYAILPLVQGQHSYGLISMAWDYEGHLSQDDRWTLEALAAYTAQAVQRAQLLDERLGTLVTLQNSMLPVLPAPADLDIAASYRPAAVRDQIGGDWYDAVVNPTGTTVMIGDVMGHDINAAASMGQLRTVLRTITWSEQGAPSENVGRFEQALADLHLERLATLVYVHFDNPDSPSGERLMRWTNAGHPPPLLLSPDGEATLLESGMGDLMVGVIAGSQRDDHELAVAAGSTVLLYTDGLIERPGEDLDESLARLRASAAKHHRAGASAQEFLDALLDDLAAGRLPDDVAALAVRLPAG